MKVIAIVAGVLAALVLSYLFLRVRGSGISMRGLAESFGNGGTLHLVTVEWCRFCKAFVPEKEKLMAMSRSGKLKFALEDVDGDQMGKEDLDKYQVKGFPTIVFETPSGEIVRYDGERTADKIVAWANEL